MIRSGFSFKAGFRRARAAAAIIRVVEAIVDAQVGTERAQQRGGVPAMLEGDEARAGVHARARQPVGGFPHQGSFAYTAKAGDDDEPVPQQVALHLEQFVGASTEAVARFGRHIFVEPSERRAYLRLLAFTRWPRRLQGQGTLLVEVGQPPVAQFDGLTLLVTAATEQVTAWVVVQCLPRALLGDGRGRARDQFAVKHFKEARGTGHQHAGAHRYRGIDPALDQARRDAAEGIVRSAHGALAGIQHGQFDPTVLQHLRQVIGLHQIEFALCILKRQLALLAALLALSIRPLNLSFEDPVSVEMQDVHGSFGLLETGPQRRKCGGTQELQHHRSRFDLSLYLVEQFAGKAARVHEAGSCGPRRDQQDTQRRLKARGEFAQLPLLQAAQNCDRVART